jgi:hypothetical protein
MGRLDIDDLHGGDSIAHDGSCHMQVTTKMGGLSGGAAYGPVHDQQPNSASVRSAERGTLRAPIARLADELLSRTTLTWDEVEAVVGPMIPMR